ncbi:hypothetical protein [Synechococcus sp. BO 8801]|uniref:hypothetical protein n=1 Tax=Synechococcus sp. BO 8801 TaxID=169670 RepID=UPI001E3927B4|nr:hypothetical protein [Synechococcus sp. BO 8801]
MTSQSPGQISLEKLYRLLDDNDWQRVDHPNARINVFEGLDRNGEYIKLVLPATADLVDAQSLISNALALLSESLNISVNSLTAFLVQHIADVLRTRSFRLVGHDDSLPLDIASEWILRMKQLLAASAYTEHDPRPSFEKTGALGSEFAHHCRFGHTFKGSFGLSIESPVFVNPSIPELEASAGQPFERRVFERIARGIRNLRDAVNGDSIDILLESYSTGLNANMCRALSDAYEAVDGRRIEYLFAWSSEIPVAEDLSGLNPFVFDGRAYEFAKATALQLEQKDDCEDQLVEGMIYQLKSKEPVTPAFELLQADRVITVKWSTEGAPGKSIRVPLSAEDYQLACDAHRDGQMIQVSGKPQKNGKVWTLHNVHGFRIHGFND